MELLVTGRQRGKTYQLAKVCAKRGIPMLTFCEQRAREIRKTYNILCYSIQEWSRNRGKFTDPVVAIDDLELCIQALLGSRVSYATAIDIKVVDNTIDTIIKESQAFFDLLSEDGDGG